MKKLILLSMTLLASLFVLVCSASAKAGDIKSEGTIEAISDTEITVNSMTFLLNAGTEYEGLNDEMLSLSDFIVGDYVEVKGLEINGDLIAREVEKSTQSMGDDDDDDDSSVGDDDDDDDSSSGDDDDDDDDSSPGKGKGKGKGKGSKNSNSGAAKVNVKDKVKDSLIDLKIRRNAKTNKKGRGKDQLDIKLKIVLPSTVPAISDEASAAAADLRITFLREGVEYATCAFAFTGLDDSDEPSDPLKAQYRLKLKNRLSPKGDALRNHSGVCDIDAATSGDQEGVPELQKGDTYSAFEVTPAANNEFVAGEL